MLQFQFHPFPTLETRRLRLVRIHKEHVGDMFALRSNVDAMRYIGKKPPVELREIEELIEKMESSLQQNTGIAWGMQQKGSNNLIGTIGYHRLLPEHHRAEIGYMLMPSFWRQGLMGEAATAVVQYGFNTMNLHSIEALVDPENDATIGLLTKLGFVKEAHFKENYLFNGTFKDTGVYALLRQNFVPIPG